MREKTELTAPQSNITSDHDFRGALIEFISGPLARRRDLDLGEHPIDATTPLFSSGLIDSMGILDLLTFVESLTRRKIPTYMVDMKYFSTIDAITTAFWEIGNED